jgi:hypothetical protein
MKKPEVSFRSHSGSGPLSIYWSPGPYGDAIESLSGNGVSWHSPNGELLGVEFDDVLEINDSQSLTLKNGTKVNVKVNKGKVTFELVDLNKKLPKIHSTI